MSFLVGYTEPVRIRRTDAEARIEALSRGAVPDVNIPFPGVNKHWPSRCLKSNHSWPKMRLNDLLSGKSGCPACSGRLSSGQAEDIMRAALYEPQTSCLGIQEPWSCRCLVCGTLSSPTLHNVRNHGSRCKTCEARRRANTTRTSLDVVQATLAAAGGCNLQLPFRGMLHPAIFDCAQCGMPQRTLFTRVHKGLWRCSGCAKEQRRQRLSVKACTFGWNLLEQPESRKVLAQHRCGFIHSVDVASLGRYGEGCPACSSSGFRSTLPGYLYLLSFPDEGAIKIGISNYFVQRLSQHGVGGRLVELLHVVGPLQGSAVREAEQQIVNDWRDNGLPEANIGSGSTESVPAKFINRDSLIQRMEELCGVYRSEIILPEWLTVKKQNYKDVRDIISSGHYTHSAPYGTDYFGLYWNEWLIGAAIFGCSSYPRTAKKFWDFGTDQNTLELKRLFIQDAIAPNVASWFVSRCIHWLPQRVELVIAFSDASAGHHGGLYQACNFRYLGQTSSSYHYETPEGEYEHKRNPYNRGKARGLTETHVARSEGLVRVDDQPKHRYAFPRSRRARKCLPSQSYPKPDRQP